MTSNEETIINEVWGSFKSINNFPDSAPHIAHYTSIETLEQILKNDEVWLSHPFNMNDIEELRYGMVLGRKQLLNSKNLKAVFIDENTYLNFIGAFEALFKRYDSEHVLDTYIMCFSEIDKSDRDGQLSMWRGYGDSGNGAALVFDLEKLSHLEGSPLIVSKVAYSTYKTRINEVEESIENICKLLSKVEHNKQNLMQIAHLWLERLKIFSLFTKHTGFIEEQEWRIAYMPDKDKTKALSHLLSYHITKGAIQPKLKLEISPIDGVIGASASLDNFLDRVILGPSPENTKGLTLNTIKRMFDHTKKSDLKKSLHVSTIPYRTT